MISPIAISLGPIDIYWYGLVYALGFLFTYWYVRLYSKELGTTKETLENILFYGMLFGVLGGRLGHIFFYNLEFYLMNPFEIFRLDKGGMSIHGGLIGGTFAIYYFTKKYKINFLKLLDIIVIPLSLVLVFGRVANFINQELVGRITTSFLGVNFPNVDDELRYPSQIFESIKNMFVFQILLHMKYAKQLKPGIIFTWFLILYNGLRFIVDFTREPEVYVFLSLGMGQVLSLIFTIIGLVILSKLKNK